MGGVSDSCMRGAGGGGGVSDGIAAGLPAALNHFTYINSARNIIIYIILYHFISFLMVLKSF